MWCDQQCVFASLDIKTAFDEARPRHVAQIVDSHNTQGWLLPPACERCRGKKVKPYFECVESIFVFNRCLRQGSVETHRLWQKWKLDNFWIMSHSKWNLEQMLRDLIEEASRWDPVPKPASLWWTSTYDSEEMVDMNLGTTPGCYKFHFEEKFKILGYALNRQGKSHDAIEERMQSAKKAF